MKTYTINGKEYTEFDINKRCAELMGFKIRRYWSTSGHAMSNWLYYTIKDGLQSPLFNPCQKPEDTWTIIEKVWDDLLNTLDELFTNWEHLTQEHNCTKLVAACICFIEVNGESL